MSSRYEFLTHWRVRAKVGEVTDILRDATDLPRWWPAVYLGVERLKQGDESGLGEEIDLYTKGFLPYTLRWRFRVTDVITGQRIVIASEGDFVGTGTWTLAQDGEYANIWYAWNIEAQKPLLRNLSWMLKPIFSANHRWAMATGLRSLEIELARRRASTPAEAALIPQPPQPTPTSPVPMLLVSLAAGWGAYRLARRLLAVR